jgi:hypothetical protein
MTILGGAYTGANGIIKNGFRETVHLGNGPAAGFPGGQFSGLYKAFYLAETTLSYAAIEQLPSFMNIITKAHSSGDAGVHYGEEAPVSARDSMVGSSVRAYRHAHDSHESAAKDGIFSGGAGSDRAACDLGTLWYTKMRGASAGASLLRGGSGVISSEETSDGVVSATLAQGSLVESFADLGMDHAPHSPLREWAALAYVHHDVSSGYSGPAYEDGGVLLDGDISASTSFISA